ncbi:MAG: hypothetical protein WC489_01315 [Patescibacteria group bacterium]
MKKYAFIFIAITIAIVTYLTFFQQNTKAPAEYKLDITHVSDQDETQKLGKRIGGHCYLASTTMMLKTFDPSIEFWQVLIARGNSTSFSYYFPRGNESEIKESLVGGTEEALKAIKNMGYQPHLRLRAFPIFNQDNGWIKLTKQLNGEVKTFWWISPMNEYKSVIASGIPLVTAGSPCWRDYNVVEGYSPDTLYVVVPDPNDEGKTDPKISCAIGTGLYSDIVYWATPETKQVDHRAILTEMKSHTQNAPQQIEMYANYLEKGSSITNFEIGRLYLARLLTAKYLKERGYTKLAAGYDKSALLLEELTEFKPDDANKHMEIIIANMKLLGENERVLIEEWNQIKID